MLKYKIPQIVTLTPKINILTDFFQTDPKKSRKSQRPTGPQNKQNLGYSLVSLQ